MEAKLTLKFDKSAIDDLKTYAKNHGTSVSRLIEEYARKITNKKPIPNKEEKPMSDWLREIQEIKAKYPPVTATDEELKKDYREYLEKKYK